MRFKLLAITAAFCTSFASPLVRADIRGASGSDDDVMAQPFIHRTCPPRGTVCFRAVEGHSLFVPSAELTSTDNAFVATPEFARAPEILRDYITEPGWMLDLDVTAKQRIRAGEVQIVVFDAADQPRIKAREAAWHRHAVYPAAIEFHARVYLPAVDGFSPNHHYLIRISQFIGRGERILAQGVVTLR